MNPATRDKLIHTALPSLFAVPNPPVPVTVKRTLPNHHELPQKRRRSKTERVVPDATDAIESKSPDAVHRTVREFHFLRERGDLTKPE